MTPEDLIAKLRREHPLPDPMGDIQAAFVGLITSGCYTAWLGPCHELDTYPEHVCGEAKDHAGPCVCACGAERP